MDNGRLNEEAKRKVCYMLNSFVKAKNLPIDRSRYPAVVVDSRVSEAGYNRRTNTIHFTPNSVAENNGATYGEECGHYLRWQLRKGSKKGNNLIVDEFFGMLGRKLAYEIAQENPEFAQEFYIPEQELDVSTLGTKKEVLTATRDLKRRMRESFAKADRMGKLGRKKRNKDKRLDYELVSMGATLEGMEAENRRIANITHYRGYEQASKVDTGKINDWYKLLRMKDDEVRRNFFRQSPRYESVSNQAESGESKRKRLEHIAISVFTGLAGILLLFFIEKATGNATLEKTMNKPETTILAFFLLCLISFLILCSISIISLLKKQKRSRDYE